MVWGPTQSRQVNHVATAAEETAKYVQISQQVTGLIQLLAAQCWNETTPLLFAQVGVFSMAQQNNNLPLKTTVQPTIRIPAEWTGKLVFEASKIYATFRDVVAGDQLVLRFMFRAWL